jgi:hypothetical protein
MTPTQPTVEDALSADTANEVAASTAAFLNSIVPESTAGHSSANTVPQTNTTVTSTESAAASRAQRLIAHWRMVYSSVDTDNLPGSAQAKQVVRSFLEDWPDWHLLTVACLREVFNAHEGKMPSGRNHAQLMELVQQCIHSDADSDQDEPTPAQEIPATPSRRPQQPSITRTRSSPRQRARSAAPRASATPPRNRRVGFQDVDDDEPMQDASSVSRQSSAAVSPEEFQRLVQTVTDLTRRINDSQSTAPAPDTSSRTARSAADKRSRAAIAAMPFTEPSSSAGFSEDDDKDSDVQDDDHAGDAKESDGKSSDSAEIAVEEAYQTLQQQGGFMKPFLIDYQLENSWANTGIRHTAFAVAAIYDAIGRREHPVATQKRLIRWLLAVLTFNTTSETSAYKYYQPSTTSLLAPNTSRRVQRQLTLIQDHQPKRTRPVGERKSSGGRSSVASGVSGHKPKKAKTTHSSSKKSSTKSHSQGAAGTGAPGV